MEEVSELLGATCGRKVARRLSWPLLADLGQALDAQAARWPSLAPRWSINGAKWPKVGFSGHLEADGGVILSILGVLRAILAHMVEV